MLSWISTVGKRCKACWSSQLKNDVHYKPAFRKERFEAQMVLFFYFAVGGKNTNHFNLSESRVIGQVKPSWKHDGRFYKLVYFECFFSFFPCLWCFCADLHAVVLVLQRRSSPGRPQQKG